MRWSLRLGKLAGIDVFIHFTFFFLLAWVAFFQWKQNDSVQAALTGVIFILSIFACVVAHELGHALTARKYGIKTRDIILLPIGGVARLEKMPDKPVQELWVALAGPAVNVVIAVVLALILYISGSFSPVSQFSNTSASFLERLMAVNIFLVLFNLIPAFPMDGGRVLRAVLATQMAYTKATQIAANLGQGIAVLFGIVGFLYNPFLLLIAIFIWIGAGQETSMTQMKSALSGIPVSQAMLTEFKTIDSGDTLHRAIEMTLSGDQKDFPVIRNGSIEGILTQSDLLAALSKHGKHLPVSDAMQQKFIPVGSLDMLEAAIKKLQDCKCQTLPVIQNERLVGLLTKDNINEFMRFRTALRTQN